MTCWARTSSAPMCARLAVQGVLGHRLARGLALQHLEAAGRHQQGAATARPAGGWRGRSAAPCASSTLGRGQLDDQVDVAPVDAEVERRGADHGAQLAPRHGRLDLAPLLGRQEPWCRAMGRLSSLSPHSSWKANSACKRVLTKTSVLPGALDRLIDLGHGVLAGVAGPRHVALGDQHVDDRRRAGLAEDDRRSEPPPVGGSGAEERGVGSPSSGPSTVAAPLPAGGGARRQPPRDQVRIVDRRRQRHPPHAPARSSAAAPGPASAGRRACRVQMAWISSRITHFRSAK